MEPINKHTVLRTVRERGTWSGYIAPSNVNAYHINDGWNLGMAITIVSGREVSGNVKEYYVYNESTESHQELETLLGSFAHYNCIGELGRRIRFWHEPVEDIGRIQSDMIAHAHATLRKEAPWIIG